MKSITIQHLSVQFDLPEGVDPVDFAREYVAKINEKIGSMEHNPQIFGGNDINKADIEIQSGEE